MIFALNTFYIRKPSFEKNKIKPRFCRVNFQVYIYPLVVKKIKFAIKFAHNTFLMFNQR